MRAGSLTRLRIAFVLLGAALLAPLFFLLRSMESRLEAQRKLRHEIVAERIFDEMERELTSLLTREGERPSDAYDATETRIASWAPFVVGYFTADASGLRVIARDQLGQARAERVERAVELPVKRAESANDAAPASLGSLHSEAKTGARDRAAQAPAPAPKRARQDDRLDELEREQPLPSKALPEAVLRQLNRGADERDPSRRKTRKAAALEKQRLELDDPLSGRP
jgi:hypothetical protein